MFSVLLSSNLRQCRYVYTLIFLSIYFNIAKNSMKFVPKLSACYIFYSTLVDSAWGSLTMARITVMCKSNYITNRRVKKMVTIKMQHKTSRWTEQHQVEFWIVSLSCLKIFIDIFHRLKFYFPIIIELDWTGLWVYV